MEDVCSRFWSEMLRNRSQIEILHAQSVSAREPSQELVRMIAEPLAACDSEITFEFGKAESGDFELTISADGARKKIDRVLELVKVAPRINGWKVHAFRQPTQLRLSMHGQTVDSSTVMFAAERVGQQLDIVLSLPLPPTTPRDQRMHLAFLMLDGTIGEFEVMTSIGTVEAVTHPAESSPRGMRPLSDLPAELARALPPRRQ